jgi:hypothetical protein
MHSPHGESRLVNNCGKLALLCLVLAPLAVFSVRLGLHFSIGLPVFALSCVLALLVVIVLIIATLLPRYRHHRRTAMMNILPAIPPALLIVIVLLSSGKYPAIHDITTNTDDPPVFDFALIRRGADSNSIDIKPETIAIQLEYYPDLATIESSLSPSDAFSRAAEVAIELNWQIYNSDPRKGLLEASYSSFWFGFSDDVVIRIRPTENGTEIDLRSVSRVGRGDLGANAKRIIAFTQLFPG